MIPVYKIEKSQTVLGALQFSVRVVVLQNIWRFMRSAIYILPIVKQLKAVLQSVKKTWAIIKHRAALS